MRFTPRTLKTAPEAWLPEAWVIEELRRQEREREERRSPFLELPLPTPESYGEAPVSDVEPPRRGVIVIDL